MSWKIVVDTGCDFKEMPNLAPDTTFERVPFTVQVGDRAFLDTLDLDIDEMMEVMYASSVGAGSACAGPETFLETYRGADKIIVMTLTGTLSGSFNSARVAKDMLLEEAPETQIHLIDSLSAGGEMDLLALEINRLIATGLDFDAIVEAITAYQAKTKLVFVLAKVDNLVKNGRLNKLVGKVVGLLNIRMVGEASDQGTLELLQKPRGQKKAVKAAIEEMLKAGYKGGKVVITHRNNLEICQQFEDGLRAQFGDVDFTSVPTSGLCSFYAEEGGILMGYEIN
ncbi:DegV family protein [Streptococcus caprae]|uniref:DegV family protein n=1 Tax=Streptococcus caprae TaxID=1640501 RepID=A0ABV8CX36_9STRE